MSGRFEDARRSLEGASQALDAMRRESGAEASPEGEQAAAAGLRAALDAARRALEEKSRALESAQVRVRELERERDELSRRAGEARPDPAAEERARRAEAEALKAKQAAAAEAAALGGRLTLQGAEMVRLDSLRRKAEEAVAQAELTRRQVEESLRREIRSAHAALDRAATEAGAREARVQGDLQGLQRRLDAALTRTDQLSREQRVERERWRVERERLAATLQRASAVHASLRKEIAELRGGADATVEELSRRLSSSETELLQARAGLQAAAPPPRRRASDATEASAAAALVARLKPAAASAYERLRELSATVPLSDAERASLRRAASSLAGLSDAVLLLERFLDDGPAGTPGALVPAVQRAAADWTDPLARRGVILTVKAEKGLPDAAFDAADMALVLDQLLRRAFESLPARAKVQLAAESGPRGPQLRLEDDCPSMSAREADSAFTPATDAAGGLALALPLARRCARRWGGDATLEKSASGGMRLVIAFRPSPPTRP